MTHPSKAGRPSARWSLRQVPEIQGAFMAMDVTTGRVLSMQGGFSYQDSVFNRTTQATRQPGDVDTIRQEVLAQVERRRVRHARAVSPGAAAAGRAP